MRNMRKAVSLLLAASLILTTLVGGDGVLAAKKSKKATAKVSSVKITNAGKKLKLQKGKKFALKTKIKVKPNKSKYKKLKFSSSNKKVVQVDSRGVLKGMKVGSAKITVASKMDPKKKASVSVSVTADGNQGSDSGKETAKPTVQEAPGTIAPPAVVPTQKPEQGAISPSPVGMEETASPEPGNATAEPETDAPGEVTAEPTIEPTEEPEEETTPKPTKTLKPTKTPKPEWTLDPDKKVENVTLTYDYEFPGSRMVRFDGTVVNHDNEYDSEYYENANVTGYPADGIDVRYYEKVIVRYESDRLTGDGDWFGKATLSSTDEGLGCNEYSDGLFSKYLDVVDTEGKYRNGVYMVEYDINEKNTTEGYKFEDVALIDCISVHLANEDEYAGFKLKSIEFISSQPKPSVTELPSVETGTVGRGLRNPKIDDNGITTWDCVYFGNYWQNDTNGDEKADQNDEKQPIKWRVLSVDGDDAFLLADESLDCQPYNDEYTDVTWETCTLRSWLNDDFFSQAFTGREQSAVRMTKVVNDDNPEYDTEGGNDTLDRVYLLSIDEVLNPAYGFSTDYSKYAKSREAKNTEYAKGRWADTYEGNGYWWLRSPGIYGDNAAGVPGSGYVDRLGYYVHYGYNATRPVLHLNLSSVSSWSYAGTVTSERVPEAPVQTQKLDP